VEHVGRLSPISKDVSDIWWDCWVLKDEPRALIFLSFVYKFRITFLIQRQT